MFVFSVAHISKGYAGRQLKGLKKLDFGQLFLWGAALTFCLPGTTSCSF